MAESVTLTRRFIDQAEVRSELHANLLAGSLWIPRPRDAETLEPRQPVEVMLVLPDGRVIDGIKGRVFCLAPGGVAVFVEDMPAAALAVLSEEPPVERASLTPPPPVLERSNVLSGDDPFAAAFPTAPLPDEPASFDGESLLPEKSATAIDPDHMPPATQPETWFSPPESSPIPYVRAEEDGERPVVKVGVTPQPASFMQAWEDTTPLPKTYDEQLPAERDPHALLPAEEIESPDAEPPKLEVPPDLPMLDVDVKTKPAEPVPSRPITLDTVSIDTPSEPPPPPPRISDDAAAALAAQLEAARGEVDFPAPRVADNPVPSVSPSRSMWDDEETLPVAKPPAEILAVRPDDGLALRRIWKEEISQGLLVVKCASRPAIDSKTSVTFVLPEGAAVELGGIVERHASDGIVLRLDPIDPTMRLMIEAAVPAAPAPLDPKAPPVPLVMPFASLGDFKKEYESNIRRGGVLVPSTERPPIRSTVEVVFTLMQGKREVRLRGECVFHAPTGVGVQISEIPVATRRDIEALLAAATPVPESDAPAPAKPIVPPPPSVAAPIAPPRPATEDAPMSAPSRVGAAALALTSPGAGRRIEGDLVEVLREAEVEGEARVEGELGSKASWLKVLASVQQERSTGVLYATRKSETKTFLVFQGRIFDAMGQPPREDESLARIVKKQNLLKPPALRALEKATAPPADEVEGAKASGVFEGPAELDKARRWQILERSAEIFGWEKGRYRFDPEGDRKWAKPTSGVPIGHVIIHGVRSFIRASGEDLQRVLRPAIDRLVKVVPNSGFDPAKVGMSDKELRFWADLDGTKSIRQLLSITPLPVSQTYRILFALCRLGVTVLDKPPAKTIVKDDRAKVLEARLGDLTGRDPFGILGISWMAALPQVQGAWDALRKELDADVKSTTPAIADIAKQLLAKFEEAYRTLSVEKNRRMTRLKVLEDPTRVESAAEMLSEKAGLLAMRGEKAEAIAAMQMALDLSPMNVHIQAAATRILRTDQAVTR